MGKRWSDEKKEYIRLRRQRAEHINIARDEIRTITNQTSDFSKQAMHQMATDFLAGKHRHPNKTDKQALKLKHAEEHKLRIQKAALERKTKQLLMQANRLTNVKK